MKNDPPDTLLIECEITDDAPDGQPWPPTGLGAGWWLVRQLPNRRTLWRRISPTTDVARRLPPRRATSLDRR
jgi:hypothetical protein